MWKGNKSGLFWSCVSRPEHRNVQPQSYTQTNAPTDGHLTSRSSSHPKTLLNCLIQGWKLGCNFGGFRLQKQPWSGCTREKRPVPARPQPDLLFKPDGCHISWKAFFGSRIMSRFSLAWRKSECFQSSVGNLTQDLQSVVLLNVQGDPVWNVQVQQLVRHTGLNYV